MLRLVTTFLCLLPSAAAAADPPLIPLADFARAPDVQSVAIAPDGASLAMIANVDGRASVVLADPEGANRRTLYRDPARSIGAVAWSGDGRWLFFLQDSGGDEGYHLFRIDPGAPGTATDLTPFGGSRVELIDVPFRTGAIVPITLDRRDRRAPDAYAIDLATGTLREDVRNDFGATDFFADGSGRTIAATAIRSDGRLELLARSPGGEWQVRYVAPPAERFAVLSVDARGTALARTNRGAAAERLIRIDLTTGRVSPVAQGACGAFDVEDVQVRRDGAPWAVRCTTERPTLLPRDAVARRAIAAMRDAAGPNSGIQLESASADRRAMIFYADTADRPGRYFRWRDGEPVREIAQTYPWLAGRILAPSRPHWIRARDGLRLLAYVTRPAGADGPRPLVVAIHGGPWSRDTGGYERESQLLANRGYAVLQVNFRGSTGLGKAVFEAGVGEFGRRMSDDIDDAVDWAIRQGIAEPGRICLLGGSYGGYATLMGLVRSPERYRCGVDFAGPVDLTTLIEAFPPGWAPFLPRSWYRFVGNPADPAVRAALASRSPLPQADRIVAPLLIFQGANDPRVTQAQSDRLVCALRRRNIPVDYLLANNEGHSFGNEETALAVNRAIELFLAEHLGGRAEPAVPAHIQRPLDSLRQAGRATACESGAVDSRR